MATEILAILRGLLPGRAAEIGDALYRAGIRIVEVPLNSPDPFTSISTLVSSLDPECLVGAGTVLNASDVIRAHKAGARLIVSPNCDASVVERAISFGMRVIPGIATPTEAFAAIHAGASELKLFPAAALGVEFLRSLREVLPASIRVFPVGGIGPDDFRAWLDAGAAGFGVGSHLFRPDYTTEDVFARARALMEAIRT